MASSSPSIVIVDYQLGNLFSVAQACENLGYPAVISGDPQVVAQADALILPGVGAFGEAMNNLKASGLADILHNRVAQGTPLMGVCLGLQLLFETSEEFGASEGLGFLKGTIRKFPADSLPVPQIAWNTIQQPRAGVWAASPLKHLSDGAYMYFVHSYHAMPAEETDILTHTRYGDVTYCSAVQKKNIFATQFHPEKSAGPGLEIYRNWLTAHLS